MAKITLDGKEFEVDPKLTVIEAAAANGIEIPHFCWHSKLSVSGNCRMCLVEIERMPKLAIACSTPVSEGMVVRTKSEKVVKARQAVMEFLLINHPLDCPICDEAGECKLQDYSYKYSSGYSRFDEDKVHKPKRVELGPNVMLDVERCIMCSRCIRFSDEIAKQPVLTFTERGTHVVLTTFPGTQLDNPYAMNVIELCPVGALTSTDFRFKSRVWEMSSTDTVCVGCSRGCNTHMWVRNNEILRLTPRHNEQVNSYWMCDAGRLNTFKSVSSQERLNGPLIRKEDTLVEVGWDEAIAMAVSGLKGYKKSEIAGVGSAFATNEDNFVFQKFIREIVGTKHIDLVQHSKEGDDDNLLIRADKTPNSLGARLVGVKPSEGGLDLAGILKGIKDGSIKSLYVLEDDIAEDPRVAAVLSSLDLLIVHSSVRNKTTDLADIVLSCSTYAEKHGTFTNFRGIVQRSRPAVATLELDRARDGFAMSRWDKFASQNDRWGRPLKKDSRPSWRILTAIGNAMGARLKYVTAEDVFKEVSEKVPSFKGFNYTSIGAQGTALNSSETAITAVGTV
ncbi:MAG: 2Fe-2S iron-sulfur cluster-binding protein [Ignavibacteriales bacterium]|nr:2Fe-2S iron-sulfur cluster-binding protein [Ignavibacteriales bacterium]